MKYGFISYVLLVIGLVKIPLYADVISSPGLYTFGTDRFNIGYSGDMISVQSNNVTLDLNTHVVGGSINGIVIESGVSGVVIENGFISSTAQAGILIKDNVTVVHIRHMGISQCGGPAIELAGTSTAAQVSNVIIDETSMLACSLSPTSSNVFSVDYGDNIIMRDSLITFCGNLSNDINLVKFSHTTDSAILNTSFSDSFGASLCGVHLDNSSHCAFALVRLFADLSTTGNFTGFLLTNTSVSNMFESCQILTCSSLASDAVGFQIEADSSKNILRGNNVISLEGNNTYGYYLKGTGTPSGTMHNAIVECTAATNLARVGDVYGVLISRADNSTIGKGRFSYNDAPNGKAVGIEFESGAGGNQWNMHENTIAQNSGNSDANSYGINVATGNSNVFIKNVASENGAIAANQLAGVSANSVTLASYDLINTITLPWTNIGITS
jgi:hypothetical protein